MARYLILLLVTSVLATAQSARTSFLTNFPWWDNPVAGSLNLSEAQTKQIRATVQEFRNRLVDARAAVEKAEGAVQDIFEADQPDQQRATVAIDQLGTARAELTRVTTQMSFKLRGILSSSQWQELRRHAADRPGRGPGPMQLGMPGQGMMGPGRGQGMPGHGMMGQGPMGQAMPGPAPGPGPAPQARPGQKGQPAPRPPAAPRAPQSPAPPKAPQE